MLNIMYLTYLEKQRQKGLEYAFHLAKALSGTLSLLPLLRTISKFSKGITIWRPSESANHPVRHNNVPKGVFLTKKNQKKTDFIVFSKSSPADHSRGKELLMLEKMFALEVPVLIVPYNYPFTGIKKILFTSNAPGFTDHPLKHQLAATFLPRAFQIGESDLQPIHWNNICKIPQLDHGQLRPSPARLLEKIKEHKIDLTVLLAGTENKGEPGAWEMALITDSLSPVLLFPPKSLIVPIENTPLLLEAA